MDTQHRSREKRRRLQSMSAVPRNPFIDDQAAEEDEDDWEDEDEDDSEDEGEGEGAEYDDEHHDDPPPDKDRPYRSERLVSRHESSQEWFINATALAEKYTARAAARMERLPELHVLQASIELNHDVPLWRLTVPMGQEAAIVSIIRPKLLTAFERSTFLRGSVYIQARSLSDVTNAIQGVAGVNVHQTYQCIPVEEWDALVNPRCSINDIGHWVRVYGKGKYRNDLAHVLNVDLVSKRAVVLLVPRVSSNEDESHKGKRKKIARCRLPPRLFNPEHVASNLEQLDGGRVRYHGKVYHNGLIELSFPLEKLRAASPSPSAAELEVFSRSEAIEIPIMVRAWSELATSSVLPGNRIHITSGEQAGLIGNVLEAGGGVVKCVSESSETLIEVPVTSVRMYFCVGDYIQVIAGANVGKFGGIINVERGVSTDLVTFIDDASIQAKGNVYEDVLVRPGNYGTPAVRAGLPEKITLSAYLVRNYDRPIESPFFPHSNISTPQTSFDPSLAAKVVVIGEHDFMGQRGVIRGFVDFSDDGVGNFQVELESVQSRVTIQALNLLPLESVCPPVGTHLRVISGPHAGIAGEVVAVDDQHVTIRETSVWNSPDITVELRLTDALYNVAWTGGPNFFSRSQFGRHPAIGLRVTVSGKHHLSGYHGIVRQAYDHLRPPRFSVELEALAQNQVFEAKYLALRQGEPQVKWADIFFPAQAARGSVETSDSVPILPSPVPLVPSTPLPPQVIFGGTPAWDPSSRTPLRPSELDDPPIPLHQLIPKPPGKLNRSKGYYLDEALNLEGGLYSEIDKYIKMLANNHLELDKPLTLQDPTACKTLIDEAKRKFPLLKKYKDNWATKDFLTLFLKTENQRRKRHAA